MMRGQALRYLGWQALDRTLPRLLVPLLIAAVLFLPLHFAAKQNPPGPGESLRLAQGLFVQLAGLAVVALFHGIVSEDRTKGFYRFYLAKPVSPLWFYAQSAVLAIIAMPLFAAGFIALFSWTVVPAWHWDLLGTALALGLLIGALIFFFSTLSTLDWTWMVVVVIASSYLRARFPDGDSRLGTVLHRALPPNHLTDELSLTAGEWSWLLAWSLGLFALGLLVLRLRPLGED